MKLTCIKYIITCLLFITVLKSYCQVNINTDSLIKHWELNGIPTERVNDYREYLSYKASQNNYHDSIEPAIDNSPVNKISTQNLCYNPGFELSDFSNWSRASGTANQQGVIIPIVNYNTTGGNVSYNTSVFSNGTFVINSTIPLDSIAGNGYDHYSFNGSYYNLKPLVNNGGNYSARINNAKSGKKARKVEYVFKVTANEPFLIYNYAFVFSDGDHEDGEQAAFSIKLTDSIGNSVVLGKLPYMVNVNNAISNPNFTKSFYKASNNAVYYKKWATDTINLCQYIGRTFKLVYESIDCIFGGHFCYAYVDARCSNNANLPIKNISCRDSLNYGFLAPPGYSNYQWTDSHGNFLTASQTGNQQFLNFTQYLQNCTTGNCSTDNGDVFSLNVITSQGCILTTTYTVKNYSINIASINQVNSCKGGNSGSITLSPSGGLSGNPYNFSWFNNNCNGTIFSNSNPLINIPAGNYCVHITNGKCVPKDTVVQLTTLPDMIKDNEQYLPPCIDSIYVIHSTGTGTINTWYQNSAILPNQNADSLKVNPTDLNSTYTCVYTSSLGCLDSTRYLLKLTDNSFPFNIVSCPNDSIALYISPQSNNPEQYQWYMNGAPVPASGGGNNDSIWAYHNLAHPYVIYNENNCKKIAENSVHVFPEQIFLPHETTNVFTPNNDGANDKFYPYARNSSYSIKEIDMETNEYELTVYNRWGALIHRSIQYSEGWNGKTTNSLPAPDGTYFWIASYISNCSKQTEKTVKKGFVQLIR